ncbi:MAG: lysine biosynthesis protein LysW [Phycisphaerae bacterium]|nr:lysine biosynthesis protein LysW [Phycisphaerae bacterium]
MNTQTPNPSALTVECPSCADTVTLTRRPLCGEVVRCGGCAVELEVVNIEPLRVEEAPKVQEDWGE